MLFASQELAARIETAECRLLADMARAVERRRPETGVVVQHIAGGVACYAGEGTPLNKVAGLGFGGLPDLSELEKYEALCSERGVPVQVELCNQADVSIGELLTRRGYVLKGYENVVGQGLEAGSEIETIAGIDIATSGAEELSTWIDVVATGFANPDAQGLPSHEEFPRDLVERTMTDMASVDDFVRYLVRRDGEPAGGGSLRTCEGVAHFCGAATLPEHRRRGIQTALVRRRLADARKAGCDIAVVIVQPGSKSQENVQRQGFELLYTRAVLVRG